LYRYWTKLSAAATVALLAGVGAVYGTPVINEVMTANITSIQDDFERDPGACPVDDCEAWFAAMGTSTNDGDNPDWVEIYNPDTVAVDLAGYALSDDTLKPRRWNIPSIILPPHGRTVFFATGKNRAGTPCWHMNFSLTAGEPVLLTAPDGKRCDIISTSGIPEDLSAGRWPDGAGPWVLFAVPTPGSENTTAPFEGFSDTVVLNPAPGLQSGPLEVSLSMRSSTAQIHYTLDGSDPTDSSTLYTGPIPVDSTTVIKARVYKGNAFTSRMAFGTYVTASYSLPVVSLTTPPGNLWDPVYGIYVPGVNADEANRVANYWQDWERPAHVEFYERGGLTFSENCGIKVDGWGSQSQPRKSLQVLTGDKYGQGWFNYRVFHDQPYDKYQCLVLRAGNDWDGAMLRDPLMAVLAAGTGLDHQFTRPVVVFLNGAYWGVSDLRENINRHYFDAHYDVERDSIDVIKNYWRHSRPAVVAGDSVEYHELETYLQNNSLSGQDEYAHVAALVDMDNFATYNVMETFASNYDWPGNNNKCWRPKAPGARWKWILYDLDYTFQFSSAGGPAYNMLDHATSMGATWPTTARTTLVQRRLFENRTFVNLFVNRYCDLMNTRLLPDSMLASLEGLAALYTPEMPRHIERWKALSTRVRSMADWNGSLDRIRSFISARPPYAKEHIRKKFDLTGWHRLTLRIEPAGAGVIRLNTITVADSAWSGDYFAGVPVRLSAMPAAGRRFVQWSGPVAADSFAAGVVLDPLTEMTVTARFDTDSGACNAVVINEINYHSAAAFDPGDWVELYNGYSVPVDVSGWTFRDSDPSHGFVFTSGTVIPSGGYLVVCADTALFQGLFPSVKCVAGQMAFGLDGSGEYVQLTDAQGNIVDSLTYDDAPLWPLAADGKGPTIELYDAALDNAVGANWRASSSHGTPGAANGIAGKIRPAARIGLPKMPAVKTKHRCTGGSVIQVVYGVPRQGRVLLRIYGLNGRMLATLVDRECAPGWHRAAWDVRKVHGPISPGVCVCRLTQGSTSVTGMIRIW
jgi:hypothetical protein